MSEANAGGVPPTFTYTIGGVRIEMPVKPYPSQVSMMDKVIRGCQKHQNCLLESPTGSGKTLALLCSALAWQRAEKERLGKLLEQEFQQKLIEWQQKEQQKKQQKEKKEKKSKKSPEKKPADSKAAADAATPVKNKGWSTSAVVTTISDDEDDDMAVFKLPGKKRKKMNNSKSFNVSDVSNDSIMTNDSSLITEDEDENFEPPQTETSKPPTKPKLVVPVIYFCTRTHKQIEQVVKELQRTSFNNVKSCVLASREFTCIQDSDVLFPIKYKTKTELCKDLLDPKARRKNSLKYRMDIDKCVYYDNGGVKLSTYEQLARFGVQSVWDIEELVNLGRQKNSCPYYASRLLLKTADIVFCPYNYIIDPVIRGTMKLKLQGHVIIVDEAHNIEDQCRDAASLKLDQINLNLAKMDCEKLSKFSVNPSSYAAIARYLSDMSKWIDKKSDGIKTYDDFNRSAISWSGTYTVASFEEFGIGFKAFEKLQKHVETVLADDSDEKENVEMDETGDDISSQSSSVSEHNNESSQKSQIFSNNDQDQTSDMTISNATKSMLTSICTVFNLFFDEKYRYDYHVSLEKVMEMKKFEHEKRATTGLDDWISGSAESKDSRQVWNNVLSFLCLNPGAVFHELKTAARTIILTSGTLSPMQSFQSELGTQFPIALEASHVIKQQQCWVTSVSAGPTRVDLNGQYQNTNTYGFQDEMGQVLKNVCETVPYGVLCFMPSYQLMEKLYARWEVTGLLRELNRIKVVMCEPRRGDQLEELMVKYYAAIKRADGPANRAGRPSGALFLAVYRGKISEGLDFSDNNARAVVAVGIPYPNYKDVAVSHKKDYNNRHHKDRGLLSGWHWYQIQGYRALNQALGRCIRHKNDWGAILLVDSRYTQPSNLTGLSKWIRGRVEHGDSWSSTMAKLKDFVVSRQLEDSANKS